MSFKIRQCIKNDPELHLLCVRRLRRLFLVVRQGSHVSHNLLDLRLLEHRVPHRHLSRPTNARAALRDHFDKILIGVFVHLDSRVIRGFHRQGFGGGSIALPAQPWHPEQ